MQVLATRSERRGMFSTSDDNAIMKQVQATHAPDGREVDVSPILRIIEDILRRTIDGVPNGTQENMDTSLEDNTSLPTFNDMREALPCIIQKITCEVSCKCSGGGDAHATTMALFKTLSKYSWDAKMVLSLAAFSVNYGEFWLVAQLCTNNSLAKSVAVLKQLPSILEHYNALKPQFDSLNKLIMAMLDLTNCIVEFKQQNSQYISYDTPAMSSVIAHFPAAAYWIIRSVVACNSQILSLTGLGDELPTTAAWELSNLAHKVSRIIETLKKQISICKQQIEEKRQIEEYDNLKRLLETTHGDNMKALIALICAKDDTQPLVDGSNKTRVPIDVLKEKHVLLLISSLDISPEEIKVLDSKGSQEYHYAIVWLPIVDRSIAWNDENYKKKIEQLQAVISLPWYTVQNPTMIKPAVIKYIKQVWKFSQSTILVPVDPQGLVSNQNVFHMLRIWGILAFPFTAEREADLWKKEPYILELLVNRLDVPITKWKKEKRLICLYGGEDIEWIRQFTKSAKDAASSAKINLGMAYVGKKNAKEQLKKIISRIVEEKLSDTLVTDITAMRYFWERLESMLYSKLQRGTSDGNDQIMKEIMTILSFDGSNQEWAIFWSGETHEMARAKGKTAIDCMTEFDKWQDVAKKIGFLKGLNDYLFKVHNPGHCYHITLPGINGAIPERVACADCGRPMEMYFMYRCCLD